MKFGLREILLVCLGVAVVALMVAAHLSAPKAAPANQYEVACISGGMPVFQAVAQRVQFSAGLWVFEIDGVEYRANFECAVRPQK